jgi:hypothetical protein
MYITGFFDDLWLDRMPKPDSILNVILAIDAFRESGNLEEEYSTTEKLLNAIRSKDNIIQMTGGLEA